MPALPQHHPLSVAGPRAASGLLGWCSCASVGVFHSASGLGQTFVRVGCRHDPRRRPGSSLAAHLSGQVFPWCAMPRWQLCFSVLLLLQADVLDAFSALAQLAEVAGDPDQAADGSHSPGRKSSDENISPANGHAPAAAGDASSSHARASSVEDSVLMKRRVQASPCCSAGPSLPPHPRARDVLCTSQLADTALMQRATGQSTDFGGCWCTRQLMICKAQSC